MSPTRSSVSHPPPLAASLFLTPSLPPPSLFFFFFNDTATTEIYTLSLHDALPISSRSRTFRPRAPPAPAGGYEDRRRRDRKSTRLNSSHQIISYAVFCLKKKKTTQLPCYTRRHSPHPQPPPPPNSHPSSSQPSRPR